MSDQGIPTDTGIVNTVTLTLASLLNLFRTSISDIKIVYDENLSYESTLRKSRADNNAENVTVDFFPCLSFKRSVLRYPEKVGPGKRSVVFESNRNIPSQADPSIPSSAKLFHVVNGEFDLEFLYFTKSQTRVEEFELTYLSEDGISKNKQFSVDLTPDLGGLVDYFATYSPLSSLSLQYDEGGNYYKVIAGKVTIRGFYFILVGNSKVIHTLKKRIYTFNKSVLLEEETIS